MAEEHLSYTGHVAWPTVGRGNHAHRCCLLASTGDRSAQLMAEGFGETRAEAFIAASRDLQARYVALDEAMDRALDEMKKEIT